MDAVSWKQSGSGRLDAISGDCDPRIESVEVIFDSGSFRDRSSRVFQSGGEIFRTLNAESQVRWRRVSTEPFYKRLTDAGKIVETREVSLDVCRESTLPPDVAAVLHHERIPFISYPYEWPFGMLQGAALLHLEILTDAVQSGLILQDASPYNVQYRGSRGVFIDIGSFVELVPGEPWSAYRQFCELMLFPLLLQAYRGVDFQPILRGQLEGIPARQFLQWIRWRDMFRPGVFTNGWLQAMLERSTQAVASSTVRDLRTSGFQSSLILQNLASLTRLVERLKWTPQRTQWTHYDNSLPHVAEDGKAKADFVRRVCQTRQRSLVWDLGCNDGRYSKIACEWASTVVAMDQDHACVEQLYRSQDPAQSKILPLRIDLANSSPALGWRGRERKRLESRGKPELVFCLGLIHHLVIAANIPMSEVIDWLASFGGELVLEFPSKRDPMVQSLLKNKRDQYDDYSLEQLEIELQKFFDIPLRESLPSGERILIHAVPKVAS